MENEAYYSSMQLELWDKCECPPGGYIADSLFGKTCRVRCQAMEEWTFAQFLNPLQNVKLQFLDLVNGQTQDWYEADDAMLGGESSMLNISEAPRETSSFPNEGKGCGLSLILQKSTEVPKKYFLSSTACKGIINRAKKRGRELPPILRKALEQQAMSNTGGAKVVKIRSGKDDGNAGKGALIGIEQSFTLGCNNDQTLFQDLSTVGGQIVYENHAQDYRLKETKVIPTFGVNPTRNPTLVTEIIPNVTMSTMGGQDDRKIQCLNPQFSQGEKIYLEDGIHPTLRSGSDAGGRGYPNAYVAQAYAIGNGQAMQTYLQDNCGTLNCMHDQIAVMQPLDDAYAIGNGQVNQLYLQDKCGALNCMVDPMKVMQKIDEDENV